MLAPIILFVFNRPEHTLKTLEALSQNTLADKSKLYIFCDGARSDKDKPAIDKVKKIIRQKNWCKTVEIIERNENFGLAKSIEEGVTRIVSEYEKVIVLEDDIVTSKGFLEYMNNALELYNEDDKVMHISGFFPKTNIKLPSTFFYNVTTCWGWATWKRSWQYYSSDSKKLLNNLHTKGYDSYRYNGGQKELLYEQLQDNVSGKIKTWAVKWHTIVYLNNGLCLHPYPSLTNNIGHDESGTNSSMNNPYQYVNTTDNIEVLKTQLLESNEAVKAAANIYSLSIKNQIKQMIPSRIKSRVKQMLNKSEREVYFEKRRLYKQPRFKEGSAALLDKPFYFVDAATFMHGFDEIFDSEIYKFNSTSKNPLIIDCGSNIGLSVVYFKKLFPNAKVMAFEPDKNIGTTLKKNIQSFNLENVDVNEKAIWINNDGIEFQHEGGFSGRIPKPGDTENIIKVPTQRLRELLNQKVDFLKMDIEGAEFEVLKDCEDLLPNIENLFIEYHSHIKEEQNLHDILKMLHNHGFRYHIHEAYKREHPFISKETMTGMDLQLNIFAIK